MTRLKNCAKCHREPVRAEGQSYGKRCHAKASKAHRDRRREELEQLRALAKQHPDYLTVR